MRRPSLPALLAALLLTAWGAGPLAADEFEAEKTARFEELESRYADSPEQLALAKAGWLSGRANAFGRQGELDRAVDALEEAIDIRRDYFPAWLALALAHRAAERYDRAIETIERAPHTMRYRGTELGGFEYDVYYVKMLVYRAIPDHQAGLKAAREGLAVLDDPQLEARRKEAEQAGVAEPGSGAAIVQLLQSYVGRLAPVGES
ncbi:MAG TPA: tetratricopeptide repeat protein [Arenicellales bacterium]|nr:tetratricopeptide repeat protein [Arenicellales bacterium]